MMALNLFKENAEILDQSSGLYNFCKTTQTMLELEEQK